jgi:glycosyltransferase involved in cell wall biosynthesis
MNHSVESPAVAILVTVFNREKYLSACLDSILASSWEDFEVIVVDDASTDASRDVAAAYAERDPRVKVFHNPANLGDYPNRARAAALASAPLLKYLDSDDLIYPHGLRTMMDALSAFPDAALGLSHSLPEDEKPYPWRLSSHDAWRKEFLGGGAMGSGPSGAIFRAAAFRDVGGFRDWGVLNDTDLWYRMSARWPIVLLPPGLVWWRRHAGQEFHGDEAALTYLARGFELATSSLASADSPLTPDETRAAVARVRRRFARRVMSIATRGRSPRVARRLARQAGLSTRELLHGLRKQA